jgi:hypothetical protein
MKVVNIGQLTKDQVRELNKKVKKGLLVKGKDYSYPKPKTAWCDECYLNFIPDRIK